MELREEWAELWEEWAELTGGVGGARGRSGRGSGRSGWSSREEWAGLREEWAELAREAAATQAGARWAALSTGPEALHCEPVVTLVTCKRHACEGGCTRCL